MLSWAPGHPMGLLPGMRPDASAFLDPDPAHQVKEDPDTLLYRYRLGDGEVFTKVYRYLSLPVQLRARAFPSRARREFRVLAELRRRDLPTLEPVACGEEDQGWRRTRSFLVTRFARGAVMLEDLLATAGAGQRLAGRAERLRWLRAAGRLARRMHEAGFEHGTFFPRNLLLPCRDGPTDLKGMILSDAPWGRFHPGPVPVAGRARDLACLYRWFPPGRVSGGEALQVLRAYLGLAPRGPLPPEARRLAAAALASAAFTRSVRKRALFHLSRWRHGPCRAEC